MKIKKINKSLYLTNTETPALKSDIKSKRMFGAEFNENEGIQVEKQEQEQDNTPKTYTKKTQDEAGNDVVLTYRSKDDALISREIKYSYGDTRTEYIKPGTNIVERADEKNENGDVILEEEYYSQTPFGKKESREFDSSSREPVSVSFYKNGEDEAYFKTSYDNGYKTEMTLLDGEPEETKVYRPDGSVKQHIKPITEPNGETKYESTIYRADGTIFSKGSYMEPYAIISTDEYSYDFDGKTVLARKYIGEDSLIYAESYNNDGSVRVREIYGTTGSRLKERVIYDKNGEIFLHTKYGTEGEITEYYKNSNSVANKPFEEKLLNGQIDTSFKQGKAATCYVASAVKSLLLTEKGKEILKNCIKYDDTNNTSTISFKGVDKEYTFTKEEIAQAMGRLGTGDPDFTAFLLGYEQYRTEELGRTVDGGTAIEVTQVLTGQECDSNIMFGSPMFAITDEILDALQTKMETGDMLINAGTPPRDVDTEFSENDNKMGLANSHAYCIKQITSDSVYLIEPTTDKEIKISRELFLEKFASYFAVDLGSGE